MDLVEDYLAMAQERDRRLADLLAAYEKLEPTFQLQLDTEHLLGQLVAALVTQVRDKRSDNLAQLREALARQAARAQVTRDEAMRREHQLYQRDNFLKIKLSRFVEETRTLKAEIRQREAQAHVPPQHLLLRLMRCKVAQVAPTGGSH